MLVEVAGAWDPLGPAVLEVTLLFLWSLGGLLKGSQPAGSDFTQECACRHQVKCEIHSVVSDSLQPHGLYGPWNSPGQNTGVGSLSLLQGIFPTQELNPGLPHCRWILYELSHQGSPGILEWVAYPFSRGSSQPRGRIQAPGVL